MKNLLFTLLCSLLTTASSAQWQKIDVPFEPFILSVVDSNTLWSFNWNSGEMARTSDAANNWTIHDIPNAQGFLLGNFIDAFDTLNAWVSFNHYNSGMRYVYRTLDGGQTWQARKPNSLTNEQIINFQKFYTPTKGILLSQDFNNHVFVYRTTDAGQNWTTKMLSISGSPLGTATYGDQNIWFYTGSGELWRSNDGGLNWSKFQTSILATSYGLALEFADSLNGLAFKDKYFNQLYRTSDGGASWQPVANPTAPIFVWGLEKIPGLPHAWMVGYNDGTAYSLDDGNTWVSEVNYPDYDFRGPVFLNKRQGWGLAGSQSAVFKWNGALDEPINGCVEFLGPLTGKLRRAECNLIQFQGSIRASIANDQEFNLRTELFYPDNITMPSYFQKQTLNNVRTSCPTCPINFIPDPGQNTIGEIRFEIPVWHAFDTTQAVLCTVSPTFCKEDSSNTYLFNTGYFAKWFHPECFSVDTSNCAVELKTNVCGQDTNTYLIYYQVDDQPAVLGTRYEKNPTNGDLVRFYIFAYGNFQNSTCYQIIDTLYFCGTSGTTTPQKSNITAIHLAPNPAGNSFQIFCNNLPGQLENTLRIRNAFGTLVWNETLPAGVPSLFIEKHDLAPGFYLVELWSGNKLSAFDKLLIVKND